MNGEPFIYLYGYGPLWCEISVPGEEPKHLVKKPIVLTFSSQSKLTPFMDTSLEVPCSTETFQLQL